MPAIGVPLACDLICDLANTLADPNDPDKVDGDQDDDPDRNNKVSSRLDVILLRESTESL